MVIGCLWVLTSTVLLVYSGFIHAKLLEEMVVKCNLDWLRLE